MDKEKYFCTGVVKGTSNEVVKYIIYNSDTDETFEIDSTTLDNWTRNGRKITTRCIDDSGVVSLTDKHLILASRLHKLGTLADELVDNEIVNYASIRAAVMAGANDGFQEENEIYMSNHGVYKHFDGSTTIIDVDGFYKNELGGYRTIPEAIKAIADDIEKSIAGEYDCDPIKGITDKEYNVDRLLDISQNDVNSLMYERIVPVIIQCKSDRSGQDVRIKHTIFLKPVYQHHDDLMCDLKKIYRIAKDMAIECIK
jgi:hypothetical protein